MHPQKCMPNSPTCNKDLNAHNITTVNLYQQNKPLSWHLMDRELIRILHTTYK